MARLLCWWCGELDASSEFKRLGGVRRCPNCNESEPRPATEDGITALATEVLSEGTPLKIGICTLRLSEGEGYTLTGHDHYPTIRSAVRAALEGR